LLERNLKNSVLFITHESLDDNLVQTQLLPFVINIPNEKYITYVITFGNEKYGLKRIGYNTISFNIQYSWKSIRAFFFLFFLVRRLSISLIHLRGINLFPVVFLLKKSMNFKLILDPRGAYPEEVLLRYNSSFLFFLINRLESLYYRTADLVIFVSYNFKNHIKSKYHNFHLPSVIIPTFYVDEINDLSKFSLDNGVKGSIPLQLVYVGSMDVWQKFSVVIDYCNELENMKIPFHLFIVTKDRTEAIKYLKKAIFKNWSIQTLKPTEISTFLNEMDIAFVFRDFSIVNEVSSPVKIQEYLYSGLFVILSDKIGDLSEFIKTKNLGYLLNTCSSEEVKNSLDVYTQIKKQRNRRESIDIFLSHYNNSVKIENYLTNFIQL
jgi:hypothetical protein